MRAILTLTLLTALAAACGTTPTTPPANATPEPSGALDQPNLEAWLRWRFPRQVASGRLVLDYGSSEAVADVFDEMTSYGLATVADVAAIVPRDFEKRGAVAFGGEGTNIAGIMRDFMIIHDAGRFAAHAFKATWCGCEDDFPAPKAYGVNLNPLGEAGVFACCDADGAAEGAWHPDAAGLCGPDAGTR